jgi:hypothetical protein
MLNENLQYPRVLEYLASVFDGLRDLDEDKATQVLKAFFYDSKTGKLQPEYLTSHVAPLAIYYAEFRKTLGTFDDTLFKEFLSNLIHIADDRLKSTFIWLFWKTLEENKEALPQLKRYIDLVFQIEFDEQPVHQMEFLVEHILPIDVEYGINLFERFLDYIIKGLDTKKLEKKWLVVFNSGDILKQIEKYKPELLPGILRRLLKIYSSQSRYDYNMHIGNTKKYKEEFVNSKLQQDLKQTIQELLNQLPDSD